LTRQHLNQHQDEVQLGGKVTVMTHGWVVTNKIQVGVTPTVGAKAYFEEAGELTTVRGGDPVGKFLSIKDEDGYAKVEINIP
jgi:hypothetical protein